MPKQHLLIVFELHKKAMMLRITLKDFLFHSTFYYEDWLMLCVPLFHFHEM